MAADLAANIRAKIRSGALLPPDPSPKCYVGKGTHRLCDGCDEVITPEQLEYEHDVTDSATLRFHAECFTAWRDACARMTESGAAGHERRAG